MHVVTGATGFVGRSLVSELLAAGHSVTALTRDVERAARHLPARCGMLVWDAERAIDPDALRGAHAVVLLAGAGIADERWTGAREKIPPAFLRFRIRGMTTREVAEGTLIDYALRLHGIPVRWQSRIESWVPNRQFVDGPHASWHHTHEFEPDDGGTIVRDRVRYRLPLGALGELAAGWLVGRDLEAVFDFRRRRIRELMA